MNVEIRAEATLFPEKEYISGVFLAVHRLLYVLNSQKTSLLYEDWIFMLFNRIIQNVF